MPYKTTAVVVNWNGARFLNPLIQSLQSGQVQQVIIVDNASLDDSVQILESCSNVTLILNRENLGFGAAANQGITASRTPYVLLLNVDTEMIAGCVEQLEQFMEANPKAAVVAPQLLYPDGTIQPSCRRFPSILRYFLFLSGLDNLIPSGYRLSKRKHRLSMEVEQPMGAALLFRKAVLDQVGLFDPQFFMYMEEVDLCERIQKSGWKIHFLAEAKAIHHAGGSTSQAWERSQTYYFTSVIRYFRKRESSEGALRITLSVALLLRSLALFVVGRFRQAKFYFTMSGGIFSLDSARKK